MSIERDENFVPRTRTDYNLPPETSARISDYHEVFEETPIYSLARVLFMQALGWQYYLLTNAMGSPMYPAGTNVSLSFSCLSTHNLPFYRSTSNHLRPFLSPTKGKELSRPILVSPSCHPSSTSGRSKLGLATSPSYISSLTWYLNSLYMFSEAVKLTVSLQLSNHWIVMLTYLHHSDPTIAHYRNKQWSFLRGAISTVDRPLLGWAGRFFLHNVSHDHVAHHLFSSIPFCA